MARNRSIGVMARSLRRAGRRRLIETMPKAELHLHLDGSVRIDTAIELARTRGVDAPRDWVGMAARSSARCRP